METHEILQNLLPQTPVVEISITRGCLFFLYSLVFGFSTGLIYEFFRILRRLFPENTVAVIVEDIIFCLSVTVLYICLVYCANHGFMRFYSVFAAAAGFFIYIKTLGAVIKRMHDALTALLRKLYSRIKESSERSKKYFKKYINPIKSKKEP